MGRPSAKKRSGVLKARTSGHGVWQGPNQLSCNDLTCSSRKTKAVRPASTGDREAEGRGSHRRVIAAEDLVLSFRFDGILGHLEHTAEQKKADEVLCTLSGIKIGLTDEGTWVERRIRKQLVDRHVMSDHDAKG